MTEDMGPPAPSTRLRRGARIAWRCTGAAVVVWAVVAGWPQLRAASGALAAADAGLLGAALACQVSALGFLAVCYRAALATAGAQLRLRSAAGLAVRAAAVSRLLPGGGGAAAVFAVRRLRSADVPDGAAAAGVTVNAIVTMGVLVLVLTAVGSGSARGLLVGFAGATLGVLAAVAALRRPDVRQHLAGLSARLRRRSSLRTWGAALDVVVTGGVRHRYIAGAAGAATAAWLCEVAALWLAVSAVGHPLPLATVALGLGAANAAAAVPHTPGGIGVVEVTMTTAFARAGVDAGVALGGVLAYRAVGFWLPVAVGTALLGCDVIARRAVMGR